MSWKKRHWNLESAKRVFENEGYQLLEQKYKSTNTKMKIICPNGHQHSIALQKFIDGKRCTYCTKPFVTHEMVEEAFAMRGWILLDQYERCDKKLGFRCENGHTYAITWDSLKAGNGCGRCRGRHKTPEEIECKKLADRLKSEIINRAKRTTGYYGFKSNYSKTRVCGEIAKCVYEFYAAVPNGCVIDHIVPVSFFDLRIKEEVLACWDIENLRYILPSRNCSRSNRLKNEEVALFTQRQLELLEIASRKPKKWVIYLEKARLKASKEIHPLQLDLNLLKACA